GRQLTSRQPPKRHQLGIKLHPQRLIGKDELRNARLREIQLNRLDVRRFLHHDADGDRHPKRLPGLVNLNRQPPSFSAALSLHVTSADITQGYKWGTGLFDPLLEKPPQVLTAFSRKDFLDRSPVRRVIAIAADEGLQAAPERLVSDFLPKEMKHKGRFVVADGIIFLVMLPQKLWNRIVCFRPHIEIVPVQHHASLFE